MSVGSSNPTTNLTKIAGTVVSVNGGVKDAGTQRVVLATDQTVIPISDNSGSLTVDAPVGTPAFVRLSNGTAAVDTLPVSGTVSVTGVSTETTLSALNTKVPSNLTTKLASSAAVAADPALVVAISPNNTVPVSLSSVPTHAVTLASTTITGTVAITDNAGSLTVDAPVGTPAFVRLSNGTSAVDTLPVSGTFWQATQPVSNAGTFPVQVSSALPVGTNTIGNINAIQSGTWTVQPGNTANTTPWLIKHDSSLGTATLLGALNAEISQAYNGAVGSSLVITASATPVGISLTPYVSYDGGTNWIATTFFNVATAVVYSALTTFTVGDSYVISSSNGATHVKVRATGWNSGSVSVRISATNSQGLVDLKSTAVHDDVAGSYLQIIGANASTTAPTAVSANGDAVKLWATPSGALNSKILGAVTTTAPTYTTGTDNPISLTTTGDLRVVLSNTSFTVTQATGTNLHTVVDSGTITNLTQLNGNAISMNTGVRDAGTQRVTIATNDVVPVSGTIAATQSGIWNISSITTLPTLPTGTNTIGSVKLTDGTNIGAIKAASTAALATDPALVVAISPNNALSVSSTTLATAANQATMITHIDGIETLLTTIEGDTSAIQTSVQLLDDTIISDNTAIGATKLLAIGGTDGTNAQMLSVNASGHVNIADGGNSITVDAPVGTPAFVRLSNGTSAVDTLPVSGTFWQATQPVSNAGTFAVQAAQSGTWNIGSITTLPALPAGTNAIGKLVANANVVIGGTEAVPSVNNALTNVNTTAYASSLIAKASAGKIYNIVGYNSKATGQFIQIHNSATLPVDTAVPVIIFYVGPMSNFSLDYGVYGKSFSAGITICNSSTGPTKTLGAADCWFTAEVI